MPRKQVKIEIPSWWPPKVGDKLRMDSNGEEYLCHVVSVFDHDGKTLATIAYYGKHRQRWHYEVVRSIDAHFATIWPDGAPRPDRRAHTPSASSSA